MLTFENYCNIPLIFTPTSHGEAWLTIYRYYFFLLRKFFSSLNKVLFSYVDFAKRFVQIAEGKSWSKVQ